MRNEKSKLHLGSVLRARCPSCRKGAIQRGWFSMHKSCPECGYVFDPGNGFFLGAMAVSYLLTALLTVPPMVVLKLLDVDIRLLLAFPFVEFLFLGTFLAFYARVLWLHLEFRMTSRLDG